MKKIKLILPVIFAAIFLFLGWNSFFGEKEKNRDSYDELCKEAEESVSRGLYAQAVEKYKKAHDLEPGLSIYTRILEIESLFFSEESTDAVREIFIDDMLEAASIYPQEVLFWEKAVSLYVENAQNRQAYQVVKQAIKSGADSEFLNQTFKKYRYEISLNNRPFYEYKTALNGKISVFDGNSWYLINDSGEKISENYSFIGKVSDEGYGMFRNDIDLRLLDENFTARGRFSLSAEDAGIYNADSGIVPVKQDGVWKYLKKDGSFLPGNYEEAGSFINGIAAARENGKWILLREDGMKTTGQPFDEIRLDLHGFWQENGIIVASSGGRFHLYDDEWKQISDFECDDMDAFMGNEPAAFRKDGLWGFVNREGVIEITPAFKEARSFSGGLAAVRGENGKWGYIDRSGEVVIPFEYFSVGYFTESGTAMIAVEDGFFQLARFRYDG